MDRIFYSNDEFAKPSNKSLSCINLADQAAYDALTEAQKCDGTKIYFIPTPAEKQYKWYYNEDQTLVVREKISDGSFRWYWNNYDFDSRVFMPVPSNLTRFIKNLVIVDCYISSMTGVIDIGFYADTIRCWSDDLSVNYTPLGVKCIMESTDTGQATEYHRWEEPTFNPYTG